MVLRLLNCEAPLPSLVSSPIIPVSASDADTVYESVPSEPKKRDIKVAEKLIASTGLKLEKEHLVELVKEEDDDVLSKIYQKKKNQKYSQEPEEGTLEEDPSAT